MMMNERRRFPRYRSQCKGTLAGPAPDSIEQVDVVTLSIEGCRIVGGNLPPKGARCRIVIDQQGREVATECEVTWRTNGSAGIKFIGLTNENLEKLRQICKGLHLEPLQPPKPLDEPPSE